MATHVYRYRNSPPNLSNMGVPTVVVGGSPFAIYVDVQCDEDSKGDLDYLMGKQKYVYDSTDPPAAPPLVVLQDGTGNPYSITVDGTGNLQATAI